MKEFKEIRETYAIWLAARTKIESDMDDAEAALKKVIGNNRSSMGLTSDKVKASPAYKKAKSEVEVLRKKLQKINSAASKEWKRKASTDRRANWVKSKSK